MRYIRYISVLLVISSLGLSGCYTSPRSSYDFDLLESYQQREAGREPEIIPEYRLGFGDVLDIRFFNNKQFNDSVTVRPDGRITMERIGDIYVAGMTPSELDSIITAAYARFIRRPDVTVIVRKFGGYKFYVLGEVNKPGGYPLQRETTILQALAAAGGPNNSAQLKSVFILRPGRNKKIVALKVDVTELMKGNGAKISKDMFYLQAKDVVYVPKTFISNVSLFLKQVYDGVLPPLDMYLRALWWKAYF